MGDLANRGERVEGQDPYRAESIVTVRDLGGEPGSPFDPGEAFEIEFTFVPPENMGRLVGAQGETVAELSLGDDATLQTRRTIVRHDADGTLPWRFANAF